MNQDLIARAQHNLETQPFSILLGTKVTKIEGSEVELSLPVRGELMQQHGFVHGGVLAYLADNSLTFSGALALQSNCVTSEMKINYVRPAIGDRLHARAKTAYSGSSQAVATCEIYVVNGGVEKLCAIAQGTIVKTP
ncbi:MAG: PaaI family thioesterase [Pseudomonadota bacterium]